MKSTLLQNIIKQTVLIGTIFHINIFAVLSGFITDDTTFTIASSPEVTGDWQSILTTRKLENESGKIANREP
ncbi:MAG: hypothetical protein ABIJ12_13970 [bacterium]